MGKLKEAQSPRGSKAKQQNTAYGASASNNSIPQSKENSNKNVDAFDEVLAQGTNEYAEDAQKRIAEAQSESNDEVLTSIEGESDSGASAVESIVLTPEQQKLKGKFERTVGGMGYAVISEPNRSVPKGTIGYVDFKNKEIYISPEHFSESLLTHELTHVIDRGYNGQYIKSLISFFKERLSEEWNKTYDEVKSKYEGIAKKNADFTYTDSTLEAETLAEMCSKLSDKKYLNLAKDMNVSTIKQIGLMFRYMASKIAMFFSDESAAHKMKIASLKWQMALYKATKAGAVDGGSGTLFMYAGEKSKTANRSLLNRAKEMSINGEEPSSIWKETGWRLGADGKWRFEIDDSAAEVVPVLKGTEPIRLSDMLVHDELYAAYPQLRNVEVEFRDDLRRVERGWYNPEENLIVLNSKSGQAEIEEDIIHEVQHAVQHIEGFESGGNNQMALMRLRKNAIRKLLAESPYFRKVCNERSPADVVKYVDNYLCKKYNEKYIEDVAYRAYRDLYGEREARDTSSRKDMQAKERRDNFSEYDKGALLGDEYSEYEIKANTILQKVYPVDMVHEMASLEDGERNSQKLKDNRSQSRVDGGRISGITKPQVVDDVANKDAEDAKAVGTSAIEEEISIIDEALKDTSLSSADRVALIKEKVRLQRQLNDGRDAHGEEDTPRTKKLEDAVDAYRESGDTSGIPTRQSVAASKKYYGAKISDIEAEMKQIYEALSNKEYLSDMEYEELCNRYDALRTQWREAAIKKDTTKSVFWWAFRDSNPGPTGYEPVALTS